MRGRRIPEIEVRHRYGIVLVAIVVPIIFSLAAPDAAWARALSVVLFAVAIVISLIVAQARRRVQIVAFGLLLAACVGAIVDVIVSDNGTVGVARAIVGLLIALAPFAMARGVVRHLRASRQVTLDAVYGAVAIYLMIGAFFATVDAAIGALGSAPFFNQVPHASFAEYLYFSYVTLSTVGYGDFTAAHSLGRALSIAEALIGQLYLVTVLALLVSNIAPRRSGEDTNG
jgi:lipoprotein signal peptidase